MSLAIWFWIFFVLSLFFGLWAEYTPAQPYPYARGGRWLVVYLLIFLLGLQAFGSPIR